MTSKNTESLTYLHHQLPELAAEARERAEEFEAARRISSDYVAKLKEAGVYKVLVSREQGGLGGSIIDWFTMGTTLAEADASTGWTTSHGAVCSALIANIANQEFAQTFMADPNSSAAWSNLPRVEVEEAEGGMRITGRWGFETGCTSATYVGGMFQVPGQDSADPPHFRVALVPIDEATIDEVWDPVGLAATGSHDVVFDNVFVPSERLFDWPNSTATYSYPTAVVAEGPWTISTTAAITHLGLVRRTLDEVRSELGKKQDRSTGEPVLAKPIVLRTLEEAEGLYFACYAGMKAALTEVWKSAQSSRPLDQDLRLKAHLAGITAVRQGRGIVRSVYDIAGAGAISRKGVMQRLYRDASCLGHHISVSGDRLEMNGRLRAGIDPPVFRAWYIT